MRASARSARALTRSCARSSRRNSTYSATRDVGGFPASGCGYTLVVPFELTLPFSALVGQQQMKRALLLNAVDPGIGGVLIRGDRGTAKSSAVRALARLLPDYDAVEGCPYRCDPAIPSRYCDDCRRRVNAPTLPSPASGGGKRLPIVRLPMRIVELPINASEDRLVGSIDIEAAVRAGTRRFQPGILAEANRNLLYVAELNLLDDHLVDVLLDAAAMGVNVVEREGMSVVHPSHFILVGTMNPEEGELRPQLLDRFGLCVEVVTLTDIDQRLAVMEVERDFLQSPQSVHKASAEREARLRDQLQAAAGRLTSGSLPDAIRTLIARLCLDGSVAGHRADLVGARTARAICALRGAPVVELPDVLAALELALAHRRREPLTDKQVQVQELASRAAEQLAQIQAATPNETTQAVRSEVTQQEGASGGESNEGWTTSESRESPTNEAT